MASAGEIKTSDLLVDILIEEGVKWVFGIPGEENLDFTESMRLRQDKIKLILTRHEQAAGFMAATIGRLTGQPGVALSTLGPGATNFTTSAAFAYLGGFPSVYITGQKPIKDSKQANFQIIDVVEMMKPITKFARSVASGNMLAATVRRAFSTSVTEKPGPVHIELAEDVASEMTSKRIFEKQTPRRPIAEAKAVDAAAEILMAAERPVVIIGGAANRQRAINALRSFVDETGIYWSCTQMGKGILDERHRGFLGCCALSDKDFVHGALDLSDVILMVGHDESEKPPVIMRPGGKRKVIHLAFTNAIVDNVYSPTAQIIGDVANSVWQIHQKLREKGVTWQQPVFQRYKELMDERMKKGLSDPSFPMNITRVCADLRTVLPEDGIISLDNGLYKVIIARLFKAYQPNTVLLDNALATMGAGIPNAIACKFLFPERKVVSISGDGGAQMNLPVCEPTSSKEFANVLFCTYQSFLSLPIQELATCVQYNIDVVHIILNDNAFGMIKWKQADAGFENWGLDLKNPDFVELAKSYGANGHRITNTDEFVPVLKKCLDEKGTHVIEVPFSYDWISKRLKSIPAEVKDMLKTIRDEFQACFIEESFHRIESMAESSEPSPVPTKRVPKPLRPAVKPDPVKIAKRHKTTAAEGKRDYTVQKGATLPFYLAVSNLTFENFGSISDCLTLRLSSISTGRAHDPKCRPFRSKQVFT